MNLAKFDGDVGNPLFKSPLWLWGGRPRAVTGLVDAQDRRSVSLIYDPELTPCGPSHPSGDPVDKSRAPRRLAQR